jgi:SAM-dependent methyltransferase
MSDRAPGGIDVNVPNVARIYDYMLGGKDNFAADRAAAEQVLKAFPESREGARRHREFLGTVVRYMAGEAGIRQFIDIGAGLPTQKNVHEAAQEVDPEARVVYIDNDPVVCVHGRALLANAPTVAMVQADLHDVPDLWEKTLATGLIDPDEPVGVLLFAILHFLDDPGELVADIRRRMAPGSHLGISHMVRKPAREDDVEKVGEVYANSAPGFRARTVDEIKAFFGDFELLPQERFVPPHIVARFSSLGFAGVARKP